MAKHPAYAIGWGDWTRREQPNARYTNSPDPATRWEYAKGYEAAAKRDRLAGWAVAK